MSPPPLLDVVIVGGGLSGLTLAHALRLACPQLQLLVLEQSRQLAVNGEDPRQLALARHSLQLLTRWQLWPQLAASATAIQRIEVSDAGLPGLARLDAGRDCYGQVVAASALSQLLQQQQLPLCSHALQSMVQQPDRMQLTLAGGHQLHSKLVVLADGGSRQWDAQFGQQRRLRRAQLLDQRRAHVAGPDHADGERLRRQPETRMRGTQRFGGVCAVDGDGDVPLGRALGDREDVYLGTGQRAEQACRHARRAGHAVTDRRQHADVVATLHALDLAGVEFMRESIQQRRLSLGGLAGPDHAADQPRPVHGAACCTRNG